MALNGQPAMSAIRSLTGADRTCHCILPICSDVPCVDGSELARAFFTFAAALVGAAMCSAFKCGTQGRWP